MSAAPAGASPLVDTLSWDSTHYARKVARIRERRLASGELRQRLEAARAEQAWLVYWLAEGGQTVPQGLLAEYGGTRVVGHVRYALTFDPTSVAPADRRVARGELELAVHDAGTAGEPDIVRLGVVAGVLSRFRRDPRLPPEKCDELYELWIRRSIGGELADEVHVARRDGAVAAVTTFRARGSVAEIGLVSTEATQRGRGVASELLRFTHGRVAGRGLGRVEVVTQAENAPACGLYERAGYLAVERGDYYHFMPSR